ncbi:hypothetical protein HDR60_01465 [bacterium]|nr:hypothetical protein [bacterium]
MRKIKSIVGDMVYFSDIKDNTYWDNMYDRMDNNAFYTANQIIEYLDDNHIQKYIAVDRKLSISEYGEETLLSDIVKMRADDIMNLSFNIKGSPKFFRIVQRMIADCSSPINNFCNNQR